MDVASCRVPDAVSVVVPLRNEEHNVGPLVSQVRAALASTPKWELILVDDASCDGTARRIAAEMLVDPRIRLLSLAAHAGQAAALQAGFDHARGDVLVTMDGDLQNDARDIPRLLRRLGRGCDVVTGVRVRRQDNLFTRRIPSWIGNLLLRRATGVPLRDTGCGLRVLKRKVAIGLRLSPGMHRFLPALAAATANAVVVQVPVRHAPRAAGRSHYGLSRVFPVLADLAVLRLLSRGRLELVGPGARLAGSERRSLSTYCALPIVLGLVTALLGLTGGGPFAAIAFFGGGCLLGAGVVRATRIAALARYRTALDRPPYRLKRPSPVALV